MRPLHHPNRTRPAPRHLEAAAVESRFREVNQLLVAPIAAQGGRLLGFLCECAAEECIQPVALTLGEYLEVHEDPRAFVIASDHDLPVVEDVVRKEGGWWVVRKRGPAGDEAERRDPPCVGRHWTRQDRFTPRAPDTLTG